MPDASDLVWITPGFAVSPQIAPDDVAAIAHAGVRLLVNNRPDGESPGQPPGAAIARAAAAAGLGYVAVPVAGLSAAVVDAMSAALADAPGPVAAFCRSGQRSAALWACARAAAGDDPDGLVAAARRAGFELGSLAPTLRALAAQT
jgi:uncharacterized protein (TIGR01244 family)